MTATSVSTERKVPRLEAAATPARAGYVCMVAYTDYATDARVRREAETLASQGFHVRCLTTRNGSGPSTFVLDGVEVQELPVAKYRGKSTGAYVASYLRFLASSSASCFRLLRKRELDVVHVHNLPDFLVFAGLIPRLAGRTVVLDVHDSVPETFAAKFSASSLLYRTLCLEERLSAWMAHRVICVNHPQREALVARGIPANKTFISMNVPDPRIFNGHGAQPGRRQVDGRFNLVYHGTMAERLGVDLIIRAAARLRERIPCLRLHLWGHGDDLDAFRRLTRELQVEETVSFVENGFALKELPRQLAAMDVGVIGNRRSTAGELMLPVKLLEYVSQDIPAVVPTLTAIRHYFTEDMVEYYEPESVDSMADAIYRLYTERGRGSAHASCARHFLAEHGWHRQGQELVALYRGLVRS